MDYREEDLQKFHEYVRALEAERHKIQMFQRELPLCLDIVTQTIESYKQQLSGTTTTTTTTTTTATAQGSEQTTSEGPVFEEFIPLKRTCSSTRENEQDEDDDEELGSHKNSVDFDDCAAKSGPEKKLDWLSSVQLWNQSPDPASTANKELPKKVAVVEVMRNGSAFDKEAPTSSGCSSVEKKEDGGQQRKSRRCWSPELHRRFLNALDQLGGSHAATPKQIRDLMKVDGLTNDEVKSHLQKYRLHSRRPASTSVANNNNGGTTSSAPQLVVVGGIWMAPPQPPQAGISGPPAPAGQPDQQRSPQRQQSQSSQGGAARCNSSANSSSTRTVTASPAY